MNTTETGDQFEEQVFDTFKRLTESGSLGLNPECTKLLKKKGYWSKDRESNIVFDLAIELWPPKADRYSLLMLIECKRLGRPVGVQDIEEFEKKREQVNPNAKGIIVSPVGFAQGAITFARNRFLGLALLPPKKALKWELRRDKPVQQASIKSSSVHRALTEGVPDTTARSEYYFASPNRFTTSPWHFARDTLGACDLSPIDRILLNANEPPRPPSIPFVDKKSIEKRANIILQLAGCDNDLPDLDAIISRAHAKTGLVVDRNAQLCADDPPGILGRTTFDPPTIKIYRQDHIHREHARFTLAHELGHYALNHHRYLISEFVEAADADRFGIEHTGASSLDRLEFQANFFASCLLMPRKLIARYFWYASKVILNTQNIRGLYVDHQPCNRHARDEMLRFICGRLTVSRQAARNRLVELNLLHETSSA